MVVAVQTYWIKVEDIDVKLVFKHIKHLHIGVYPPRGEVRVSVPFGFQEEYVRQAVRSRLPWIYKHSERFQRAASQNMQKMVSGEFHYVWGRRCQLSVTEQPGHALVTREDDRLDMRVPPGSTSDRVRHYLDAWYRTELKNAIPGVLRAWEPIVGARASDWGIRRMKTLWGSCNASSGRITINLELAKKHPESLDCVVVHELVHLLERGHGPRFKARMDRAMPDWRARQHRLSQSVSSPGLWTPS
ncbi:M48 family metallopeptidase [Ferrimicrobium acidiphilum]|uniref:M48 family metallopeptidase n=1 Tax=Ferrimicrobium acidiphilum TaxID=121039 RepID=UPI0023F11ED0|nr:SprT family zinc-dependent metalloprotease [Ferrimicrobium acidiphilum]